MNFYLHATHFAFYACFCFFSSLLYIPFFFLLSFTLTSGKLCGALVLVFEIVRLHPRPLCPLWLLFSTHTHTVLFGSILCTRRRLFFFLLIRTCKRPISFFVVFFCSKRYFLFLFKRFALFLLL